MPSRRHWRQRASPDLAIGLQISKQVQLNTPSLGRSASVVRDRCDIADQGDLDAYCLERADGALTARARSTDKYINTAQSVLLSLARCVLGGKLRAEWGALLGTLEPNAAGGGPRDQVAAGVGYRDDRVVERALDMDDPLGYILLFFWLLPRCGLFLCHTVRSYSYQPVAVSGGTGRLSNPY